MQFKTLGFGGWNFPWFSTALEIDCFGKWKKTPLWFVLMNAVGKIVT